MCAINSKTISELPKTPGVYLMRDRTSAIIYVGKAVNLNNRVGSYFQNKTLTPKIASLVSNIQRVDYLSVQTEEEALILENDLIKKYQPKYNTLMRDDKTYPHLALTLDEKYPRLILTRNKKRDGKLYFGPFPFVSQLRSLQNWLVKNFGLRPCKEKIGESSAKDKKKYASCLYMHIKKCPAPCMGGINRKQYLGKINNLKLFLKGRHNDLLGIWKRDMAEASKKQDYEAAAQLRDRIFALENIYNRIKFKKVSYEDVDLSVRHTNALSELKTALGLRKVPLQIESFDISNIAGELSVGSMVKFKNGLPDKSSYRLYKIKTVEHSDDPAMIHEVVKRRYVRIKAGNLKMPDLILVDGGKTQLNAAVKALECLEIKNVDIISLAKRNEEVFMPGKDEPVVLDKDSVALKLLMRVRDETHRFAVSFYRKRHSKQMLETAG